MTTKIAINGFGRIGRAVFKIALENKNIEVVALNDLMDNSTLAHLLKYDTVYGEYEKSVSATKTSLRVGGKVYPVYEERDPSLLPWKSLGIDVVLECTGIFRDKQSASGHVKAGAKKVIISAPAKDDSQTIVFGTKLGSAALKKGKAESVISNASCTTNSISAVMQILSDSFGIEKAMMTTVHSYTAGQNLVDGPNKDLRRARAAAQNIVPTTTGAAKATTKVVTGLENLFDGIAIRVPTICVSLSDLTVLLKRKKVTAEQVNNEFKKAAKSPMYKNIVAVNEKPLVSSDFIKNPYSSIVDLSFTKVVGGNMVKILAWYDNEWGYSQRLVQLASEVGKNLK